MSNSNEGDGNKAEIEKSSTPELELVIRFLEFLAKLELANWAFLKVTKLELNFQRSLRVGVKVRVAYFGRDKMFKVRVPW
jgi:hypothetical protein